MKYDKPGILKIIGILILLWIVSVAVSMVLSPGDDKPTSGNVVVIPIKGIILGDKDGAGFLSDVAESTSIVEDIEKAGKNEKIKAVVFEINTPGGSAVASDEVGQAIKRLNKTTVSYIREVGASGGYWIASSTDRIFVNRMTITGSIGVIASYLQFSGFLADNNITYERMVGGKFKDLGSPFKKMSDAERAIFQKSLDAIHEEFIKEVALNRGLEVDEVRRLATGQIFLGREALELGLVDEIGGKEEVKQYLETALGEEVKLFEYEDKESFLDLLSEIMSGQSFSVGQGIGSALLSKQATRSFPEIWS
ncbi:MAG: signal peptide peptidase SppA [Candidatus Woesearchaeota archaeon]|jgi:protease-4|nr:signal peptide peptidase SppA [Candidatus Woesearchaeota archaeon]MDP7323881.1 signal peptide peptidase SppA [Candidatus Woesearchaeota archaeon]